ncbi:MAG: 50S ribosomal protein L18 [bacterium]|nr:50S ribosomal protein L18 [bacterium]
MKRIRLAVFRSNKYLYCQAIDDVKGITLASVDKEKDPALAGQRIAEKLLALKVKKVVFDRRNYRYHGNIKKLAEAARAAGLDF